MSLPNSPIFPSAYRCRAGSLPKRSSVTFDDDRPNASSSPSLLRRLQVSRLKVLMSPKSPIAKSKFRVSPFFQMDSTPVKSLSSSTSNHATTSSQPHQKGGAATKFSLKNSHQPANKGIMKRNKDEIYRRCSSSSSEDEDPANKTMCGLSNNDDDNNEEEEVIENVSRLDEDNDDNCSTQESRISGSTLSHGEKSHTDNPRHSEDDSDSSSSSELHSITPDSRRRRRPFSCTTDLESDTPPPPPSYDSLNQTQPQSAPIIGDTSGIFLVGEYAASRKVLSYPVDRANETMQFQEVREALLERVHEEDKYGIKFDRIGGEVYIISIQRDSIAAKVGLKVGDKIVRINDHPVSRMSMTQMLNYFKSCLTPLKIAYKPRSLMAHKRSVTLQKLDGRIGMRLQRRYHIDGYGVFVDVVIPDSPASRVGLKDGDQILKMDGEDIRGWSQERATQKLKEIPDGHFINLEIKEMLPMAQIGGGSSNKRKDSFDSTSLFLRQKACTPTQFVLRKLENSSRIFSEPNSPVHTRFKNKTLDLSRCDRNSINRYQTISSQSDLHPENFTSQLGGVVSNHREKWNVHGLNFNPQISYV